MQAGQVAVFPVALLKAVLEYKRTSFHVPYDAFLANRFGYVRAQKMTPSVVCTFKDLSYVHCGRLPLVGWVGYRFDTRWPMSRGCYINTAGEHVYPA